MKFTYFCILWLLLGLVACEKERGTIVGSFSQGRLEGWEAKAFQGETRYRLVELDGRLVLEGDARSSASGLFKPIEVDLLRYPVLNWAWKITGLLEGNDEQTRAGDDFPVRVFILTAGAEFFGDPLALNYVWSRNQPVGANWVNPFVERATMLVVESGPERVGQWVNYQRNLREDLKRYLKVEAETILGVALMVDTDNTKQAARSYFGDIFFSVR